MIELKDKPVLVAGLDAGGRAACEVLCGAGARVTAMDPAGAGALRVTAARLSSLGVEILTDVSAPPQRDFALAVVSPAIPMSDPLVQSLARRRVPVIGELELCFRQAKCLGIAIAGTNGKSTTAEMVERTLVNNHRKTLLAGPGSWLLDSVAERSKELDFVVLEAGTFQLERTQFFRPAVAVLLNLAPDHLDRYTRPEDYVRAHAGVFRNQQPFDWAIVQADALARLEELHLAPPSKVITFSASRPESDIHLDRGLIISRLANWPGPLLDMDQCRLRGPHHAENLMAALAVGHALRLPLEAMVDTLKTQAPGPHRFQFVAEVGGVQFINDSKAANVDALRGALLGAPAAPGGEPNVWLIAGGDDKGLDFHAVGPEVSRRVKRAFLIGETREKIRAAWSLFTPCTLVDSLLEAVTEAAKNAAVGDVVLLSPACSSFDEFQNYQQIGERFCQIVKSISRGPAGPNPNINGKTTAT